jgi:hypothetical protein
MSFTQFAAHFLVAALAVIVAAWQPRIMGSFMRLRRISRTGMPGFFLALAAEQICVATRSPDSVIATFTLVQLMMLVWMLIGVGLDARRAVVRLSNAIAAITEEYDGLVVVRGEAGERLAAEGKAEKLHAGSRVLATINHALYGADE